jgi:hypothetical protein
MNRTGNYRNICAQSVPQKESAGKAPRWSASGILQQRFRVVEYRNGFPYTEREEWRDVPTEAPRPSPNEIER